MKSLPGVFTFHFKENSQRLCGITQGQERLSPEGLDMLQSGVFAVQTTDRGEEMTE